jgi:A/G-specific adenine glycosylase
VKIQSNTCDAGTRARFTSPLVRWYRASGRELPWRNHPEPYGVLVSEIMLQQTQVTTVIPYYGRFMSAYPSVRDLAEAPLEQVLKQWQGLGYYSRARYLHRSANQIIEQYGGVFPSDIETLMSLPGIGRSTAGAILTIAMGQRHPILDGNVRRVLCRFFAIKDDPRAKRVETMLWNLSSDLLPRRLPGFYLQAIMDLGATICKPAHPICEDCPVKSACGAKREGLQAVIPLKKTKKKSPHFDYVAGVIFCDDAVLIRRRPMKGLLAGLWEFPGDRITEIVGEAAVEDSPDTAIQTYFKNKLNLGFKTTDKLMTIKHIFTHFKMTLHVFRQGVSSQVEYEPPFRWAKIDTLTTYPFSTAQNKIVLKLEELNDGETTLQMN